MKVRRSYLLTRNDVFQDLKGTIKLVPEIVTKYQGVSFEIQQKEYTPAERRELLSAGL